jgi:Ser/Thr protein kinase RdoA (MazF antagonist)
MKILEYLRDQPIRVAQPIPSIAGNVIETIETEIGTFYAVVFEALKGDQLEVEQLELKDYSLWGRELGQLHSIFKTMPIEYRTRRKTWRDQMSLAEAALPEHEEAARKELTELKAWAQELSATSENFGLIHYDFELDNQRWLNEEISILDFDDCMNHWYGADIAFALRDVLKTDDDLNKPIIKEFIKGYQLEMDLDVEMVDNLPKFIRMHNLFTFVGLLGTVDIHESENHPEWLKNLRVKLMQYIGNLRLSFMK